MSIRSRLALIFLTVFALYGATDFAIRAQLVWPAFSDQEQQSAKQSAENLAQRLRLELSHLDTLTHALAAHDGSYRFVNDADRTYEQQLHNSLLDDRDLDLIAFYDRNGRRQLARQAEEISPALAMQISPELLSAIHRYRQFDSSQPLGEQHTKGILITTEGPWLLASRPILHNNNRGPIGGYFITGKRLDAKRLTNYQEQLGGSFTMNWKTDVAPIEGSGFAIHSTPAQITAENREQLTASIEIRSADGHGQLVLHAINPRSFTAGSLQQARNAWFLAATTGLALLLLLSWLVNRTLVHPIQRLSALMQKVVDNGDYSQHPDLRRNDEIGQLANVFDAMMRQIQQKNAVRELNSQHLQKLAGTDALTGIANRRSLEDYLERCWKASRASREPMALILCDIDHFKLYNDHYGHLDGDLCLQRVAQIMSVRIQRAADRLFRYGGEEFAVILPDTDLEGALQLAHKLRLAVFHNQLPHAAAERGRVTMSLGVAASIGGEAPSRLLLDAADRALYEAKKAGRNQAKASAPVSIASQKRINDFTTDY